LRLPFSRHAVSQRFLHTDVLSMMRKVTNKSAKSKEKTA